MKKLLLLFVAVVALTSCDTDDNYSNYMFGVLPTESADVPEEMEVGKIYRITLDYIRPTNCYNFYSLDYIRSTEDIDNVDGEPIDTQIRTIAVINRILTEEECIDLNETTQVYFDFEPRFEGPYVFRFWIGEDEESEDEYIEYEAEVVHRIE